MVKIRGSRPTHRGAPTWCRDWGRDLPRQGASKHLFLQYNSSSPIIYIEKIEPDYFIMITLIFPLREPGPITAATSKIN